MSTFPDKIERVLNYLTDIFDKSVAEEFQQLIEEEEIDKFNIIINDIKGEIESSVIIEHLTNKLDWNQQKQNEFQVSLLTLFEIQTVVLPKKVRKATKGKTFTLKDELLMYGFVRESAIEWVVSTDIIHLLLLFCTIGDMFQKRYCNKKIIVTENKDLDENKYSSKYQIIETIGGINDLMSSVKTKRDEKLFHAFGSKIVTRVKYKWHLVITEIINCTMYIGIVDTQCVPLLIKNEKKFIPEKKYFFTHGYGLCVTTGDVYHKNSKYGKPYIINPHEISASNAVITLELDLSHKIYGTLKFMIRPLHNNNKNKSKYWNNMCFAYDDILVHKKISIGCCYWTKC